MAGFVLFTDIKPYFHFLLSSHGWSSEGLPTIEELTVSQATPEKKSTDKSPSRIQDLLSGDAFTIMLKHVTIQTLPLSGWKRKPCPFLGGKMVIFKLIVRGMFRRVSWCPSGTSMLGWLGRAGQGIGDNSALRASRLASLTMTFNNIFFISVNIPAIQSG